jgi:hypothetical protein
MQPGTKQASPAAWWQLDRGLLSLVLAALALSLLGLISIALVARREPDLAPAVTPEGIVQRFYQAAYQGDYQAAYALLSADTRSRLTIGGMQQELSGTLARSQMHVAGTSVYGRDATVRVTITHLNSGGLFGTDSWVETRDVLLTQEAEGWRIVSGAVYVPERLP